MEAREYEVMARLQDRHWWFAAKRRVVRAALGRLLGPPDGGLAVLEAGCGTGAMLPVLRERGRVVGLDAHLPGLLHARGAARVGGDLSALPFPDRSFDLVAAFDVLYHRRVPDVGDALAELFRVCRAGGHLLLTDSAVPALRGPHDVAQHGARRFRRSELTADLARAGFEVRHSSHYHTLLFPLAAPLRLLQRWRHGAGVDGGRSDMRPLPAWLDSLLGLVYRLEAPLAARLRLPLGLSLLAVARRPAPCRGTGTHRNRQHPDPHRMRPRDPAADGVDDGRAAGLQSGRRPPDGGSGDRNGEGGDDGPGAGRVVRSPQVWLVFVVAVAAVLRLVGLGWGLPFVLMADEELLLTSARRAADNALHPGFFGKTSLFTYQVMGVQAAAEALGGGVSAVLYASRLLAVLYSLATVVLLFLIGRRMAGPAAGLLGAAAYGVAGPTVLHAHYALWDVPMTALAVAAVWAAVRGTEEGSFRWLLLAAAFAGLAVSTKQNGVPAALVPLAGALVLAMRGRWPLRRLLQRCFVLGLVSAALFVAASPYVVLDFPSFLDWQATEWNVQRTKRAGFHDVPAETARWTELGVVRNAELLARGLGPLALVALLGLGVAARRAGDLVDGSRSRPGPREGRARPSTPGSSGNVAAGSPEAWLLPAIFVVAYYALMGTTPLASENYLMPLYALLGVLGAAAAVRAWRRWGPGRRRAGLAGLGAGILLLWPAIDGVAMTRMLAERDTRLESRDWILANLPPGSRVAREFYAPPLSSTTDPFEVLDVFSLAEHSPRWYCDRGVEYLVTSSGNYNRYLQHGEQRFERRRRWYLNLGSRARLLYRIDGAEVAHHQPTISVHLLKCFALQSE